MEVRVTVVGPAGVGTDVLLRCPEDTSVGEVRQALLAAGLWDERASLHVGSHRLDQDDLAGEHLLEGSVLRPDPAPRDPVGTPAVRVVAGPRCGATHLLLPGATVIGRGADCGLRVDDEQVSRRHARLDSDRGTVVVTDLGSTNTTGLDGHPLTGATAWSTHRLRVGASTLVLTSPPSRTRLRGAAGRARIAVPPRLRTPDREVEVRFPAEPGPRRGSRLPVAAALAPALVGLVAAAVLRSPTFLLFALLSPVVVLVSAASDRAHAHREHREARRDFARQTRQAADSLAAAVAEEEAQRHEADPDCAELLDTARRHGPRLWERRPTDPDVARARVGTADLPARVRVHGAADATCHAVPVAVDLTAAGALGLVGGREDVLAVARAVVGSAAVLHAPSVLRLVVLCPGRAEQWAWVRWLPHARDGAGRGDLLVDADLERAWERLGRLAAGPPARGADTPRVLLVVDSPELRDHPDLAALLEQGRERGVHAVCLATTLGDLPSSCPAVLQATDDAAGWTLRRDGELPVTGIDPDGTPAEWADAVARALAPLVLPAGRTSRDLPPQVAWDDVTGVDLTGIDADVAAVLSRWESGGAGPVTTVGVTSSGPLTLDLREDGPHCLVAGATGSGKSELLQTLVAGLALANPPEALQLVLVDYKGGAAFGTCARLPHTAGVVTDLDPSLTRRALASLGAELRRREEVLLAAGVADLAALDALRLAGSDLPPLPRLVLVVDEFASLAEELPEFVRGLVAVAQRGRSLGVHLVLATQRPEGAVSQDIRANTALRLCLAMTRESDSRDVLDAPDAATIGQGQPGRGYLRRAGGPLVPFQAARVAAAAAPAPASLHPPVEVRPLPLADWAAGAGADADAGNAREVAPGSAGAASLLDLLVDACATAARARPQAVPPKPWLPPLPDRVTLADLAEPGATGPAHLVPFAVQDVPASQARRALNLDLRENFAVVGGPRSGRSTTLLTVAAAAAQLHSPADLHVVGLDASGTGLRGLDALPHCGALVTADESERLRRLVSALTALVRQRRTRRGTSSGARGGTAEGSVAPGRPEPHLLVLVDQWDALVTACGDPDGSRLVDDLLQVLRDGPAVGVTAVVSSDRSVLVGRVAGLLPRRLLLRLPDLTDYASAGLAPREVPRGLGPGRGLCPAGLLTQVALVEADGEDPAAALARLGASLRSAATTVAASGAAAPDRRPLRVDPLPTRIALADVEALAGSARPQGAVTVGIGGDELRPARLTPEDRGPVLLVSGPPRSGRSTALLTLLAGLQASGRPPRARRQSVVVLAPRRSPLRRTDLLPPGATVVTGTTDALALQQLLATAAVVVVDDAELVVDTALGPVLDAAVASARDDGTVVLAAGTTSALLQCYRGWVTETRRARTGLLLAPESPADGELLGCRLPRGLTDAGSPPGRGVLVTRGVVAAVQVALPPGGAGPAAGAAGHPAPADAGATGAGMSTAA